ncbi:alpha/beta fold hydrolase [Leucobacter luti]|uniref:alpha/beta fold hydrolase n=1 Tax=Leucobacter luti TaxID=340320 RepID=UPI003D00040B
MPTDAAHADDEFRFLAADAARVGREAALPQVRRMRFEAAGGTAVSGLAFDPARKPQLVALHGAGLNAHSFDPALLALGRPALALDLPGHGRSDWRSDADYSPAAIAPSLTAVLRQAAGKPVTLVGHSLGGLAGALVAAAAPELVSAFVVVDITPSVVPGGGGERVMEFITGKRDFGGVDEIIDRAIEFGIGSDRSALERGIALNTRRREDGRLEWTHHLAHLPHLAHVAPSASADPAPTGQLWAALAAIPAPVTLIRASHGMVDDALEREWRERLPASFVERLDGPHNLHEAEPLALAAAIDRAIARAAGPSGRMGI